MKIFFKYLLVLLMPCLLYSQSKEPTKAINGKYYLMAAEKGIGSKMTKEKLFQYGVWGKDKVLMVAACNKCSPAMYKYNNDESQTMGVPFFYNIMGLYMITYDHESFIMMVPANKKSKDWTDFTYSNFYSKNKAKADIMTKQKIVNFIKTL